MSRVRVSSLAPFFAPFARLRAVFLLGWECLFLFFDGETLRFGFADGRRREAKKSAFQSCGRRGGKNGFLEVLLFSGLGSRHFGDGFEDARANLVGIALGVGAAVFEVAFVVVFDEAVRHAYGGASVGHAPVEFVDGLGFVQAGQALFVFRAVGFDVLVFVSIKGVH